MHDFGERIGRLLRGGEVIELVGDVGAGKTTFVRGLAQGMGVEEPVQSPSFTISRVYDAADDRQLLHYDFYRLDDPGIMRDELHSALQDQRSIVVIEWAGIVDGVLPDDRLVLRITTGDTEDSRDVTIEPYGELSQKLSEAIR